MITQEDIDAMDDRMAVEEWGIACAEHIAAQARIEQLERELAAEKALADRLAASYAMSLNDTAKVKACPSLDAYRKARGL